MTPNELLLATAAGDRTAFAELCDRMDVSARLIIRGHLQEPHQIDTVIRSVHDEAWQTAGSFDPAETTANQWMLSLARGQASARARRLRRLPADRVVRSLRGDGLDPASAHTDDVLADDVLGATTDPGDLPTDARRDPLARQLRRLRASVARRAS